MVSIVGAIIITIATVLVLYVWRRIVLLRRRVRKETREAQDTLHYSFDALKDDVSEQFENLRKIRGKKRLVEEEDMAEEQIDEGLEVAERFSQKEIEDIEKELD